MFQISFGLIINVNLSQSCFHLYTISIFMHFDLIKLKVYSQFICLCSSSLSDDLIQVECHYIFAS